MAASEVVMEAFERAKRFFIAGLQCLERNNLLGAESAFSSSLELLPDRVSTLNNLAAVKIRLNKLDEAETYARRVVGLEENSVEAWSNLGIIHFNQGQFAVALQAYEKALEANFMFARAWAGKAEALLALQRNEEALDACEQAVRLEPGADDMLHTQSLILKALGRIDEARKVYMNSMARRVMRSPVYSADRRASQKADVLIISPDPVLDNDLKSFDALHRECPNYAGQLMWMLSDEFHFSTVFKADAMNLSGSMRLPPAELLINNCANAELILSEGSMPGLIELVDSCGMPVVNHPNKVVQSGRDTTARLVADIPGVRVPRTMRFSAKGKSSDELVRDIESHFTYPLITRTLMTQKGIGMNRASSRAELLENLREGLPEVFFVTEFVETRGHNKFYRKIRTSVVASEFVIVRVDFHDDWKVHGGRSGRRVAFYLEHPELLEEERRICADPEEWLGKSALEALRTISKRIPLDVFGLDFEVDADGKLVFFESNATMNLLTNSDQAVANPREAHDRLLDAFRRYFCTLTGWR
ncbi:MAG: hypothetical protein RLY20_1378 [Verrucomicrobiota bacterium]|jgi:Flp pilus assembly protein TadD/glutathione synthase/RimK-type ligase-like ATP-grasp enzyme